MDDLTCARIQDSIEFIESNLHEDISIHDIARQASFSIFHFQRLFKQYTGYSTMGYLRKRRLTRLAMDLCVHQKRVIDIAYDYNFGFEQSLIRAFKNEYGVTPGEFRRKKYSIICTPKLDIAGPNSIRLTAGQAMPKLRFQHRVTLVGKKEYINASDNYQNNLTVSAQNRLLKKLEGHPKSTSDLDLCCVVESIKGDTEGWYFIPTINKEKAKNARGLPDEFELDYHYSYFTVNTIQKPVSHLKVRDFTKMYTDMYSFLDDAPHPQDSSCRYTVYNLDHQTNQKTSFTLHCPIRK